MKAQGIILQPVVSEKSFNASDKGVYMFRVANTANRRRVRDEIERKFKVTVTKVNLINCRGKKVMDWNKRRSSYRKDYKKAVVTLKKGDSIDIFK